MTQLYIPISQPVEARQWDGSQDNSIALLDWISPTKRGWYEHVEHRLYIYTATGLGFVEPGDWIVRMPNGKFRAVRNDEFTLTHRPYMGDTEATFNVE